MKTYLALGLLSSLLLTSCSVDWNDVKEKRIGELEKQVVEMKKEREKTEKDNKFNNDLKCQDRADELKKTYNNVRAWYFNQEENKCYIKYLDTDSNSIKEWATEDMVSSTDIPKHRTQEEITNIKSIVNNITYLEGDINALITIIEYSDLEDQFSIRLYKEGTIKNILDEYGNRVNYTFKNMRNVPHENSEIEASALLCAGDIGGRDKYIAYYKAILTRTNGANGTGTGFSKDALLPLSRELKIDEKEFQSCIDSKKNIQRYNNETMEGRKLWVKGTPWIVFINNQTGEYEVVNGAYQIGEFKWEINKLLGTK